MDFLDIPLRYHQGAFQRVAPEEALGRYVALFFASRKHEALRALDFGVDLDRLSWISAEDYIRELINEFNRVHRGTMSLRIGATGARGGVPHVGLHLRFGRHTYQISMSLGEVMDA
ncbi:MAG: hypothetical protein KAY32_10410 [Candidatus Eisenbacteria sp.]|nr:hypothetical protein [Candidatus Eisenbacteria bacterium]